MTLPPEAGAPFPPDPNLPVVVHLARSQRAARERALVLQARGIPHEVRHVQGGFALLVPLAVAGLAQRELALYEEENEGWPPREEVPTAGRWWIEATGLAMAVLVLVYFLDVGGAFGFAWRAAGEVDGAAMRAGALWRAVTALTLHAGVVHLLSNLVYGALFGGLAAYALGGGLGWLATVVAGTLGNLVNAWIHAPSHLSIGASTAVFGAVGVLSGSEVVRRHLLRQRHLRRAAPILVAFLLLGYLGMGGAEDSLQRTDVSAHLTGLLAGLFIGLPLGRLTDEHLHRARLQLVCGAVALLLPVLAWWLALAA